MALLFSPSAVRGINRCIQTRLSLEHFDRVVLIKQRIAELIVGDLPILALVKVSHDDKHLLIGEHEAILLKGLLEFVESNNTVVVCVEATENVTDQRKLLPHGLAELLKNSLEVHRFCGFCGKVLVSVF